MGYKLSICALSLIVLSGCTASHYRKSADRDVYRLIKQRTPRVPDMDPNFTIERTNLISLKGLPIVTNVEEFLGVDAESERGASILSLKEALDIAVHYSRTYQNNKEQLYLSALSLTLAQHAFTPIFSAGGQGTYAVDVTDGMAETHTVSGRGSVAVDWLIRDLGKLSVAFTTDFLRYLAGDPRTVTSSQIGATFARPLLRNAGYKQEMEALTQAERNLLYQLRDFTQFRKDFTVQIATAYYGVLGIRDTARNNFLNLQTSKKTAEQTRALAAEGRRTQADLGRLQQQELSAESSWINSIRNYKQSLDNFKIQLGLNVETNIVLDDHELEALQIQHPDISVEDSIKVALAGRLDYANAKDQFEDAERQVKLAADRLKPRLDITASAVAVSDSGANNRFSLPRADLYRWDAGLTFDPGLDRTADRNSYRSSLISRDRASRNVEQQEDQIKLEVRDSWRTLDQAKRNYEISDIGVKLAERRVEEQNLLAELGRARALDQVDAQNSYIDSKNQRTQALVTHTIARLQFWNNMGILYIKDNGQWEEIQSAKAQ